MKNSLRYFIAVICVCQLILIVAGKNASAQLSGPLSGVITAGTYTVEGNIFVQSGDSLIIEPRVTFGFVGSDSFNIYGYLYAVGTETDSIKFKRAYGWPPWNGINFWGASDDGSQLKYCIITGSDESGIHCNNCNPTFENCSIYGNSYYHGGGIRTTGGDQVIKNCVITANTTTVYGGGISFSGGDPIVENCIIYGNSTTGPYADGGAIYMWNTSPLIKNCTITGNSAANGGGLFCYSPSCCPTIENCTISDNSASTGGGISCLHGNPVVVNSIIWGNTAPTSSQIFLEGVGTFTGTYCDIEEGWVGEGNIDADPMFVSSEQYDYRLQWGSPCIDTGNPDPVYNDPDDTVCDMGSYFYDQSIPVRIIMIPHDIPIRIPAAGGSFDYTIQATNIDPSSFPTTIWCDIILPNGSVYGPVLGPVTLDLGTGITISRDRTQTVPSGAPYGGYSYNAYAVAGTDTSFDCFTFSKLESDGSNWYSGWFNTGESFGDFYDAYPTNNLPSEYALYSPYPNPFNQRVVLGFALPAAAPVKLTVYDITGSEVAELVNEYRDAGIHEITFDAKDLASGVYYARLTADGGKSMVGKMVLLK